MPGPDRMAIFERLYREAATGGEPLPWEREGPHPQLGEWARDLDGTGRRALVVGSGLGTDAEFLAGLGFAVTAFDASAQAIELARQRSPGSAVDYRAADLLDLPGEWIGAFDFVLESLTVQSMPIEFHAPATLNIARSVGEGGTLLVIATRRDEAAGVPEGPPWPLTRAEVDAFAADGLEPVAVELLQAAGTPDRWRAEFRRP